MRGPTPLQLRAPNIVSHGCVPSVIQTGRCRRSAEVSALTTIKQHPFFHLFPFTVPTPKKPNNMGDGPATYRSVAYFVNWAIYGRNHHPQDLPAEALTHVLYAFANVRRESGEVYLSDAWSDSDKHYEGDSWNDVGTNLYGCLKQLNLLKKRNRSLKILLSVGGWTYSPSFAEPASTPEGRKTFAESCVGLVRDYGFDGIDVDWEYPSNAREASDLLELLRAVRSALDAYAETLQNPHHHHHFELTIATSANKDVIQRLDIPALDAVLDFWNLMAYDYAGSWDASQTGHLANLYPSSSGGTPFSTRDAVAAYVAAGISSPDKLVLGMPLYGRGFSNTEDSPGARYSGVPQGSWEAGVFDYKALPLPNSEERHDLEVGAASCYDRDARTFVSYDSVPTARQKARFIREHRLGGAMWWETSGDKVDKEQSLIWNVVDELGGPDALDKTPNCLQYPHSKYDNLRAGFPEN
ncbi:glycoside hydrolase superfamily [Xylariaceae sp. FL0594]|nr:glycoside hydrolase superfamily [Xylariaceae sp. FL0594]